MSHLVIAGTGRAGTSFLVKWLDACGLDVGSGLAWHRKADAGLERNLLDAIAAGGPYVVKDPWLWTYCDRVDPAEIDVLVLPMRELQQAAWSRVKRQMDNGSTVGPFTASTPGGMIHELNTTDQARILAIGFYELLWWAQTNGVRTIFPLFPRIVNDPSYALDMFRRWLARHTDPDKAVDAHRRIARPRTH